MNSPTPARSRLLILGDRHGLAWVLRNSRMAFTATRVPAGAKLAVGDRLFLYTSRGCFGNPTRDRGRLIGEAEVVGTLRRRQKPVTIAGREYTHECAIVLKSLTRFREGVELAELVSSLSVFPDPRSWSARMRRPLLALPDEDADLIAAKLDVVAFAPADSLGTYAHLTPSDR